MYKRQVRHDEAVSPCGILHDAGDERLLRGGFGLFEPECKRFVFQSFGELQNDFTVMTGILYGFPVLQQGDFSLGEISGPTEGCRQRFPFFQCIQGIECAIVLIGSKPDVSVVVVAGVSGGVDRFTVGPEPCSHFLQTVDDGLFDEALWSRTYSQQVTASLGGDFNECVDDFSCRFVGRVGHPAPIVGQGDAALPGTV